MTGPLTVIARCADRDLPRVRYVIDSLLMALDVPVRYASHPPSDGPWLLYAERAEAEVEFARCLYVPYRPSTWESLYKREDVLTVDTVSGLPTVLSGEALQAQDTSNIRVDLFANAFWFLSSWAERSETRRNDTRGLYSESAFKRLGIPQDVVDLYLDLLRRELNACCERANVAEWPRPEWLHGKEYAVVLSHDVDFIPANQLEIIKQGVKTLGRHLVRERSPLEAIRAGVGLSKAVIFGRDPYGCLPEMIAKEKSLGVQASYQVAVGHRHPVDVNYRIEDDRTRDYLRVITENDFDLCLHGSYRSTEDPKWYAEEVELLSERLGRPLGSRQHFLSFDYDALFEIQEKSGIQFDMSMGFPDYIGPRAGFSFPYFPWNIEQDRPYNVLEISLFLMDVTLRSYMGLRSDDAFALISKTLNTLRRKHGGVSVVWHPIVFGNARDPGYGDLFWQLVDRVNSTNGWATDGRTINRYWRQRAAGYPSFAGFG